MSLLTLRNERRFDRDLRILIPGGIAGGLSAAVMALLAGQHHHSLMALGFGGILGLVAALTDLDEHTPALRAILALLGGAVAAIAFPTPAFAALFGGMAMGLALSVEDEVFEQVTTALSLGAALAAGVYTTGTLFESGLLQSLDVPFLRELVTGGIWGAFLTVGAGAKQLKWDRDVHRLRLQATLDDVGSAERGYLEAARDLYQEVKSEMGAVPEEVSDQAGRIAVRTLEALQVLCGRSTELRQALRSHPKSMLKERLRDLDNRLEHCRDASIAEELAAAREELAEQLEIRDRLEMAIVRLEVRQQRCVTALERLHIQLVRCGGTEEAEMSMDSTIRELEKLAEDIEWQGTSVDDLIDPNRDEFDGLDLEFDEVQRDEPVVFEEVDFQKSDGDQSGQAEGGPRQSAQRVAQSVGSFEVSSS